MVFTNDHEPPHVHVFKGGAEAIIELFPIEIRENYRMSRSNLHCALELVSENHQLLSQAWNEIHGH
jgi:hypothetical protein